MLSQANSAQGVPDIETFQQALYNEHLAISNSKSLIDFLPQQEQAALGPSLTSQLNAFLGANLEERLNFENLKNALQTIKYLCNNKATVEIKPTGSYFCCYCFDQFNSNDISAELFNQSVQNERKFIQIPHFTLQCGHSIHFHCFKQLTKDFLEQDNIFGCECPSCDIGCGQIQDFDIQYFQHFKQ